MKFKDVGLMQIFYHKSSVRPEWVQWKKTSSKHAMETFEGQPMGPQMLFAPHEEVKVEDGAPDKKKAKVYPDQEVVELATSVFSDKRADHLMEKFRQKLAPHFGITVMGNHMTLRTYFDGAFVTLSMQVVSLNSDAILTPHDSEYDK